MAWGSDPGQPEDRFGMSKARRHTGPLSFAKLVALVGGICPPASTNEMARGPSMAINGRSPKEATSGMTKSRFKVLGLTQCCATSWTQHCPVQCVILLGLRSAHPPVVAVAGNNVLPQTFFGVVCWIMLLIALDRDETEWGVGRHAAPLVNTFHPLSESGCYVTSTSTAY